MTPSKQNPLSLPAILVLENGAIFKGSAVGASGLAVGEVVFNTAMTGYQEILTDPSYAEQLVTLTYPHIGNVGVNAHDRESSRIWAKGLIMRNYTSFPSNWQSEKSLGVYLMESGIVAIADVDTRRLTRLLREEGAQAGCILAGECSVERALSAAHAFSGLKNRDLTPLVSTDRAYDWSEGSYDLDAQAARVKDPRYHVIVYDFGVKQQILRLLVDRSCRITVVPASLSALEAMALSPDGIVLSNGPGDPAACVDIIEQVKQLLPMNIPLFGICLGFQLLALALGSTTQKMKFGHHGANHPVKDLKTGRVMITSQNHGFSVDTQTLPLGSIVTHESLFDGTLQGFRHERLPILGFQGHPEASPGPDDMEALFDDFISMISVA